MILAVPGIGVLKILLAHTDHLKPFVILLEDKDSVNEKIQAPKPKAIPEEKVEEKMDNA
jgi:hypothetical protein